MPPQQIGGSMPLKKKVLIGTLLAFALLAVAKGEQGQTRIQSYNVSTTIEKRLAKTHVTVDFLNEKDCATVRGFTMHLPINARVTALSVVASNQCEMSGEVKTVKEAQQEFDKQVTGGKAAALLQSWDEVRYPVWVSLPPLGTTRVEIDLEELLHRRNDQIAFQVPLSPGLEVDTLIMDVSVSEPDSGIANFDMDTVNRGALQITRYDTTRATAHLELTDVSEDELNRLIHGSYDYDPAAIPDNGLTFGSGTCVSYLFNPSESLLEQYMPRNLLFVIDVSGSMQGQKLADAKAAFSRMIQSLTTDDFFAIHTFSSDGTEEVWGPSQATSYARNDARTFVNNLGAGGGTNLYWAFGDGLTKVRSMHATNGGEKEQVPILVILTDGQATTGTTDSRAIARFVRTLNTDIGAKIFALAFGEGADLPLLLGICIQNGGKAVQIFEGYDDSAVQMEDFYKGELGRILLADVNFDLYANSERIGYQTQTKFPVFPSGSEFFVRARTLGEGVYEGLFRVITTATSVRGSKQWTAQIDLDDASVMPYNRECVQSFAHEKISEILRFRDAARSIGDDLEDYSPYPTNVAFSRSAEGDIVSTSEARALELALEAGVVWPGLTAMVTVENEACSAMFAEGNKVCTDGDRLDDDEREGDYSDEGNGANTAMPASPADTSGNGKVSGAKPAPPEAEPDADGNGMASGEVAYESDSPGYSFNSSWSTHLSKLVAAVSFVLATCLGVVSA